MNFKVLIGMLALIASGGSVAFDENESLSFRIDQDTVSYVDANMIWANDCEFKLNQSVTRNSHKDGKVTQLNDWKKTLAAFCDDNGEPFL